MQKHFVCLAKSIKYGNYCVAGKEILNTGKVGNWFRPIHPQHGSIPPKNFPYNLMDILCAKIAEKQTHPSQPENYILDERPNWRKAGVFPSARLSELTDSPLSIWGVHDSSSKGINDRVSLERASNFQSSLLFIFLPRAVIWKCDQTSQYDISPQIRLRLNFKYNGEKYSLAITDPALKRSFWHKLETGEHTEILNCYYTFSLGEPFSPSSGLLHCYKLVAGHINV